MKTSGFQECLLNPVFSKKNISASTIRYRRAEVSAKVLLFMVLCCLILTHATLFILTRTTMRTLENNGSYSEEVLRKILILHSCIGRGLHESYSLRQQCLRSVYYSYTLLQNKKVSNRSQVLLISRALLYMRGFHKKRMGKNNLLSAVTRRRLRRFMYFSENIYRLDIFILCVFFQSRIKFSVNNKLYMRQICHI
jgi:uncharacterized protein YneF (UPF0154 family)